MTFKLMANFWHHNSALYTYQTTQSAIANHGKILVLQYYMTLQGLRIAVSHC